MCYTEYFEIITIIVANTMKGNIDAFTGNNYISNSRSLGC